MPRNSLQGMEASSSFFLRSAARKKSTKRLRKRDIRVSPSKRYISHLRTSSVTGYSMTDPPYAKGKRGLIFLQRYKGRTIAVKKKNPLSSSVARMDLEAHFLQKVNAL